LESPWPTRVSGDNFVLAGFPARQIAERAPVARDAGFMKSRKAVLLIIALLTTVPLNSSTWAKEAYLSDIVVTNTRDYLLVYFTVNDCFTPEMNKAIESGINTSFTFFVRLYENRTLLWNKKIASVETNHSIKYDNLKEVYEVRFSGSESKAIVVKDFEEAKKLVAEVVALKVTSLHNLRKGGRYQLQMMAELDKIELPLYLHHVFFFLSLWDFQTDWYKIDFRY
jgi:hypothetical protein